MFWPQKLYYVIVVIWLGSSASCSRKEKTRLVGSDLALINSGSEKGYFRLPLEVIPKSYRIQTRPVLEKIKGEDAFTADDVVRIDVICAYDSRKITLHAWPGVILIKEEMVKVLHSRSRKTLAIKGHRYDSERHFYIIELKGSVVREEEYEVVIPYRVNLLHGDINGYYRTQYRDPRTDRIHYMAATKLEPVYSRKAFPCFDEPGLKATFEISIARRKGYVTVSNTMVTRTEHVNDGWIWDHYAPTPVMSTYLVSFFVGEYDHAASPLGMFRIPMRVWGPEHQIREMHGGELALTALGKYLEYFEKIYSIKFEIPKMDVVSLEQYPSAAMEHWGALTFKERSLMYFPGITTEERRLRVLGTISHEISHQWMGNLVTPAWWSDIWLSEGFASYFEGIGRFKFYPEFDLWQRFYVDRVAIAMAVDIGEESHPLRNNAESPEEIKDVFGPLSYSKGGAVIRMLGYVLGTKTLCSGLRNYLKNMAHKSAVQDDLFRHLQNVTKEKLNIKEIMDSWTLQSGYPLVRVRSLGKNRIQIEQEEFKFSKSRDSKGVKRRMLEERKLWHIPVRVMSANDIRKSDMAPDLWLRNSMSQVTVNTSSWVIVNPNAAGYYRVMYDDYLTFKILEQFNKGATMFSATTRAQILNDVFNLHISGRLGISAAMRFTQYLGTETDIGPWTVALNFVNRILKLVAHSRGKNNTNNVVQRYILEKISDALENIGLDQPPHEKGDRVILRAALMSKACALGHKACQNYAKKMFIAWMKTERDMTPPDLRPVVYCQAVRDKTLGKEALRFLVDEFERRKNRNVPDPSLYLAAMGCSRSVKEIKRLFRRFESYPPRLRQHRNKLGLLLAISEDGKMRKVALEMAFKKTNGFPNDVDTKAIEETVQTVAKTVFKAKDIEYVNDLIKLHGDKLKKIKPQLDNAIGMMESNRRWRGTSERQLVEWVNQNPH